MIQRRVLFVHAHPDDESINNAATMARYVAEAAQVTLITCTRGEQGEVIGDRLSRLLAAESAGSEETGTADEAGEPAVNRSGDALGDHRVGELAAAMARLGVTDHRFLGDPASPGRVAAAVFADGGTVYRDSGMAYDDDGGVVPSLNPPAGAFALVDADQPAELLATVIRELRPQVVVGYEPGGGYGHPDHVQAHLITMRAVELAALAGSTGAAWGVPKVYWTVMPESLVRAGYHGHDPTGRRPSEVVADDQVTAAIDGTAFIGAKADALRAHETQISVSANGASFALSNGVWRPVIGREFYRLARGESAGQRDDLDRETDLFAGVGRAERGR